MSILAWIQLIAMAIQLWKMLNSETAPPTEKDAAVVKSISLLDRLFPKAKIGATVGAVPSDDVKTIFDFIKDINTALRNK